MADPVHDGPAMNALIHKAVRRDLDDFDAALRDVPTGDTARAAALAARFRWLDTLLTQHHEGEERILWPVLRGTPSDTAEVAELSDEHERIVTTLADARTAMERFGLSGSAEDAASARTAVDALREAANEHFRHEEAEMVELCSHVDPEQLRAALRALGREAPLKQGLWFMQWVADGTTADESARLRTLIPSPLFWISRRVTGRDYARSTAPLRR